MFRCLTCGKEFNDAKIVVEPHGERHGICPHCSSSEFSKWEPNIEKCEVAEKLLEVIAALNRLQNNIADVFGNSFKNEDLEDAQAISVELIDEMYDEFMPLAVSNAIRKATSTIEVGRIMHQLKGV